MKIEFDPPKDKSNQAKHGVSLAEASRLDWDRTLVRYDDREDYGEDRFIATGPVGPRLFVVTFTMRDEVMRVISMRAADRREFERHEAEIVKGKS